MDSSMRFRLPVKSIAHWLRLQVATVKSLVLTNRSSAPFSVFCFLEEDMVGAKFTWERTRNALTNSGTPPL